MVSPGFLLYLRTLVFDESAVAIFYAPSDICGSGASSIDGSSRVPDDFSHHDALDSFNSYFDHHAHEFITITNYDLQKNTFTFSLNLEVSGFLGFRKLKNHQKPGNKFVILLMRSSWVVSLLLYYSRKGLFKFLSEAPSSRQTAPSRLANSTTAWLKEITWT